MKSKSPLRPTLQKGGRGGFKLTALLTLFLIPNAQADQPTWHTSWDGTLYGYANNMKLRDNSLLNPGNQIARLSQNSATAEARFDFKADSNSLRFTMRPIVSVQDDRNALGNQRVNDGYLSQWQLRFRTSEAWSIAAGREVLNWGPAQFRSPSSPFYFDNGRSNPLLELSGVDTLKLSWTPDMQRTVTLARINGSGHVSQDIWRNSWLLKADQRSDNGAIGLALAQTPGEGMFLGAHGQLTASDALLLYSEASSSTRANALKSPTDITIPFRVESESPRQFTILAGAAYTFNNGQSVNAEMMYYGHGFSAQDDEAYFSRATISPLLAGQALGYAPPLLGRDYLHLVWQSNLMETGGYWRIMLTHGFTDNSNELSGYGEIALTGHVTAFALGALPAGNARQEFSSLYSRSLTAGVKVALP